MAELWATGGWELGLHSGRYSRVVIRMRAMQASYVGEWSESSSSPASRSPCGLQFARFTRSGRFTLHRASVRKAREMATTAPVRLNLASGSHPKTGWLNVDLFAPHADLRLDLREPLPFLASSVDTIYAEHFFEHLEYPNVLDSGGWELETADAPSEALGWLRECHRVLRPGGVLEIIVPDTEGMIGVYVNRHNEPPVHAWWGPQWCDTPLHHLNYLFRQGRQHKYAYDEETLRGILSSVGFAQVIRRAFDPAMEAPNHEFGSLCIRAVKPQIM